ncbi:MAG: type IX secretion system membrane protein PorP/SprF [Brumimicrobium sp.]|nr:type IX secretion system membrane protein PorP/SprF [Brumimicrobium sp.]
MSSPSFENIDQWLFEYMEGNLSSTQETQLMQFVAENPELAMELDAWKKTKISNSQTTEFAVEGLLKPAPQYAKPIAITSGVLMLVLLGWWITSLYTLSPLYLTENIDTSIIYAENQFTQLNTTTPLIAQTDEQSDLYTINSKKTSTSQTHTQTLNSTNTHSNINNVLSQEESENHATEESNVTQEDYAQLIEDYRNSLVSNNSTENNSEISEGNNTTDSNIDSTSDLATHENIEAKTTTTDNEGIAEKNKVASNTTSHTNKSNARTFFNGIMRKIDRMTSKPLALQSTKNPSYHIPMMVGTQVNPALAGTDLGNRILATSRIQWMGSSNSQLMNTLAWDGYISGLRGGLGFNINYNTMSANKLNSYSAQIIYSPKLAITRNISIEPALSFKMGVVNLNKNSSIIGNKVEFNRQNIISLFEEDKVATGSQLWYKDIGLGFMLNTKWFYAGANFDNLSRHNNNYYSNDISKNYKENIHYSAVIGTEYQPLTANYRISTYAFYQNYGKLNELWAGANFEYKWIQFGAGMSTNLDFGASAGFLLNQVHFTYNIDYTKSELLQKRFLSHQLTMKVLIKPTKRGTIRYVKL